MSVVHIWPPTEDGVARFQQPSRPERKPTREPSSKARVTRPRWTAWADARASTSPALGKRPTAQPYIAAQLSRTHTQPYRGAAQGLTPRSICRSRGHTRLRLRENHPNLRPAQRPDRTRCALRQRCNRRWCFHHRRPMLVRLRRRTSRGLSTTPHLPSMAVAQTTLHRRPHDHQRHQRTRPPPGGKPSRTDRRERLEMRRLAIGVREPVLRLELFQRRCRPIPTPRNRVAASPRTMSVACLDRATSFVNDAK